jgi:hypothetical protein
MDTKQQFQTGMEGVFQELSGKIEELKIQTDMAEERARVRHRRNMEDLLRKREEMKEKLAAVKESTDEAWDSLKEELTAAALDLKSAVDEATLKFKKRPK